MWPSAAKPVRLEELVGPTPLDVVTTVLSPDAVLGPVSGLAAAFVQVEVLERLPETSPGQLRSERVLSQGAYVSLGAVIFGDLVTLQLDLEGGAATIDLVARRAELHLLSAHERDATPVDHALPELVPLLSRAKQGGLLCQREHLVRSGARLRLRAVVERAGRAVASRHPSALAERLIVRDDLAPVRLDEVLDADGG